MPKVPRKEIPQTNPFTAYGFTVKKGNNKKVVNANSGPHKSCEVVLIDVDEEEATQESGRGVSQRQDVVQTSDPDVATGTVAEDGETHAKGTRKTVKIKINKTRAEALYRLSKADMDGLEIHETKYVRDPNTGQEHPMFLYLEQHVERAAWTKHGGRENFIAYLYKLLQTWAKTHDVDKPFKVPKLYRPYVAACVHQEAGDAIQEIEEASRLYLSFLRSSGQGTGSQDLSASHSSQAA